MVYTVTFNPAIDYVVHTDALKLGQTNRTSHEEIYFGGKGINVSAVLAELGIESRALGFTAGFTGEAIEKGVAAMGIHTDFVRLEKGSSRINVKIKADCESEINAQGPEIDSAALGDLYEKLDILADGDTLVLAGSIPDSMPRDVYERILARLDGKRINAVVDATGQLLMNVLKYRPFLVKPNDQELGEMFGVTVSSPDDAAVYAKKLKDMGAVNVLVSMAEKGAVLVDENGEVHKCGVCRGEVRNSVGAGDSMVAGFIAGALFGADRSYERALKLGTAAGGATAFSDGLASRDKIQELFGTL